MNGLEPSEKQVKNRFEQVKYQSQNVKDEIKHVHSPSRATNPPMHLFQITYRLQTQSATYVHSLKEVILTSQLNRYPHARYPQEANSTASRKPYLGHQEQRKLRNSGYFAFQDRIFTL